MRTRRLKKMIRQAKVEILADIAKGIVPSTVGSFGELHDYVDANYYGGLFDVPFGAGSLLVNPLQDALDRWIREGRP